ncbi:hypothetical protein K474DRAFT_1446775 [Panus rudis PR-1116 ss-1]|nr:hypothetical protein K474DRAFT_1446775 [Panus rudis PR-1116 ss-1]
MTNHDDHREAHVMSLRLVLGSILSPKRSSTPSTAATSGTASPLPPHSSVAIGTSSSSSYPVGSPDLPTHDRHRSARMALPRTNTAETSVPTFSKSHQHSHAPSPLSSCHSTPDSSPTMSSIPIAPGTDSQARAAPPPVTATSTAVTSTGSARADFIGTLQSKKTAWDALIHGSFV